MQNRQVNPACSQGVSKEWQLMLWVAIYMWAVHLGLDDMAKNHDKKFKIFR